MINADGTQNPEILKEINIDTNYSYNLTDDYTFNVSKEGITNPYNTLNNLQQ